MRDWIYLRLPGNKEDRGRQPRVQGSLLVPLFAYRRADAAFPGGSDDIVSFGETIFNWQFY
jgi:hypothetical protein